MKFLIVTLLVAFQPNMASANWLCREAASLRNDDIINACGIGEAEAEGDARTKALNAAYQELDSICSKTPDCANFDYVINPLRTDCEKTAKGYKCYRGIEATITTVRRDPKAPRQYGENVIVPVKKVMIQEDLLANKLERSVVQFSSIPSGASVHVDGIQICETPCSRELQLGQHQILIEKNNYEKYETSILVKKDSPEVSVSLANMFGYLDINDIPIEAIVKVDDIKIDESKTKLKPGKHIVTIESPFHQPYHKEIEIKKGVSSKLHNVLEPLYGYIEVSAKDRNGNAIKANVYIDGESVKEVTPAKIKIPSGTRKIELVTNNNLYASATRTIEADTLYNYKFILDSGTRSVEKPQRKQRALLEHLFEGPTECNSESDCSLGYQCATIRGQFPGSCVKKGIGF